MYFFYFSSPFKLINISLGIGFLFSVLQKHFSFSIIFLIVFPVLCFSVVLKTPFYSCFFLFFIRFLFIIKFPLFFRVFHFNSNTFSVVPCILFNILVAGCCYCFSVCLSVLMYYFGRFHFNVKQIDNKI